MVEFLVANETVVGSNPTTCSIFLTQEFQMKVTLEIRAAEGGEDSKLFVKDLAQAYCRMFTRVG